VIFSGIPTVSKNEEAGQISLQEEPDPGEAAATKKKKPALA
jgi:hypothetical protein